MVPRFEQASFSLGGMLCIDRLVIALTLLRCWLLAFTDLVFGWFCPIFAGRRRSIAVMPIPIFIPTRLFRCLSIVVNSYPPRRSVRRFVLFYEVVYIATLFWKLPPRELPATEAGAKQQTVLFSDAVAQRLFLPLKAKSRRINQPLAGT